MNGGSNKGGAKGNEREGERARHLAPFVRSLVRSGEEEEAKPRQDLRGERAARHGGGGVTDRRSVTLFNYARTLVISEGWRESDRSSKVMKQRSKCICIQHSLNHDKHRIFRTTYLKMLISRHKARVGPAYSVCRS